MAGESHVKHSNVTFDNNVTITGTATLSSTLSVTGAQTFTGDTNVNGTLAPDKWRRNYLNWYIPTLTTARRIGGPSTSRLLKFTDTVTLEAPRVTVFVNTTVNDANETVCQVRCLNINGTALFSTTFKKSTVTTCATTWFGGALTQRGTTSQLDIIATKGIYFDFPAMDQETEVIDCTISLPFLTA